MHACFVIVDFVCAAVNFTCFCNADASFCLSLTCLRGVYHAYTTLAAERPPRAIGTLAGRAGPRQLRQRVPTRSRGVQSLFQSTQGRGLLRPSGGGPAWMPALPPTTLPTSSLVLVTADGTTPSSADWRRTGRGSSSHRLQEVPRRHQQNGSHARLQLVTQGVSEITL